MLGFSLCFVFTEVLGDVVSEEFPYRERPMLAKTNYNGATSICWCVIESKIVTVWKQPRRKMQEKLECRKMAMMFDKDPIYTLPLKQ